MRNLEDPRDRLNSWKDIAAYLGRDVSTVQRWERREAMPVHRHVHEKLGSVFAFRSELEAWSRGRSATPEPSPGGGHRRLAIAGLIALGVAGAIFLGLRIARSPGEAGDRGSSAYGPGSGAAEVRELLQPARYLGVRTTASDSQKAIALVERAIALDPGYAPAHAALASAYVTRLAYVTPDETGELEEKAFAAVERALSLDPNLPEAFLARGDLLWTHSQRFAHDRAVQEFRRALSLDPRSDEAHRRLARVYVHLGFFDEALEHAGRALALNSSNAQALNSRAQALLWMGKDDEALSILSSIPGPVLPELVEANVSFALMRLGRHEEARTRLRRALREHADDPAGNLRAVEAMLLARSDPRRARALIEDLRHRKSANPSHHAAYFAACALARLGQPEEAVLWLREAAATGFPCHALFARDPNLDPIRRHPQFRAFMAEMERRSASLRKQLFDDPRAASEVQ